MKGAVDHVIADVQEASRFRAVGVVIACQFSRRRFKPFLIFVVAHLSLGFGPSGMFWGPSLLPVKTVS
jgi:hypothetical protein